MAHSAQTNMINKKYFILNYPLANSLIILAILFHVWSGGSEFLGIQGYMSDFIENKFPDNVWATRASLVIPLLLAVTIEFSFVALLRYVANSLLFKTLTKANIKANIEAAHNAAMDRYEAERANYEADPSEYGLNEPEKPEKPDIDMVQTANIIMFFMASVALVAIFLVSMLVSKKSIEHDTKVNGPKVNIVAAMDSIDHLESRAREQIYLKMEPELRNERSAFHRDSLAIVGIYQGEIAALNERINEYDIIEKRTNKSYGRSKSRRQQEINRLESERSEKLNERSTLLAKNEQMIRDRYAPDLAGLSKEFKARRSDERTALQELSDATNERNRWFSMFLRNYAQLATVGQLICWVYVILAYYVMGIVKKPRVRPESLESGLISDLALLLYTAPTRWIHNGVRSVLAKVPPLHQMPGVGAVYDLDTLNEIAPLLEKLDKTKSLEEKEKIQRSINRKINGYQDRIAESVDSTRSGGVEKAGFWRRILRSGGGVVGGASTRRTKGSSTRGSTRIDGVESEAKTGVGGVEKPGVESTEHSVITPYTREGRGVVDKKSDGVESSTGKRRKEDTGGVDSTRSGGVDSTRSSDGKTTRSTKGDSTDFSGVELGPKLRRYDKEEFRKIVLKAGGEQKEVEIRVVIDDMDVMGIYNKEPKSYDWLKQQRNNYSRFLKNGERNPITNEMRIQLFEAYMELIEEVQKKYKDILTGKTTDA